MTTSEFSLIDQFFKSRTILRNDVCVGIGDDAAVTDIPDGMQLISALDTLVSGVHFPENASPYSIGYKSLAVNLSDLAAMGAEPVWALLALTLPRADENWVKEFSNGFFSLAEKYNIQLIGGDTTQGPLTISVQVMGLVPCGNAILRHGAQPGDRIFVSGTFGDAAAALYNLVNDSQFTSDDSANLTRRLEQPVPRVELGLQLRGVASSAIDVSDGLVADLGHILDASEVGATLRQEQLPLSATLRSLINSGEEAQVLQWALHGGDDYELCFTAAEENLPVIEKIAQQLNLLVTEIGVIDQQKKIRLLNKNVCTEISPLGYQHFSKP